MREIPLEVTGAPPDPSSPEVKILVPVSDSYINAVNETSITIGGFCSENNQQVSVSVVGGSTLTFTPVCASHLWSIPAADLSSLSDGPVIITADHQDSRGNIAATSTKNYTKDTVIPTIASVSTTSETGNYTTGSEINVTLNFSEVVAVTGTPKISLNTTPSQFATYVSGAGSTSLIFTYTVQAGDQASRLDYSDAASLVLDAGAAIADIAGNNATNTLPDPADTIDGLYDKNIWVDTSSLTVTLNQDSSQADPTTLTPIIFKAVFSHVIDPSTFTISDIDQTGTATVSGWTITNPSDDNMTFILSATEISGSGTVIPSIAAGVVQTSTGIENEASTSSDHEVTYDITDPVILSVTTTNSTGYYSAGAWINVTVNFSEPVTVDSSGGTPAISLNTTPAHDAAYVSGSGTSSLVFQYQVQSGDADSRVDYTSIAALSLNGSTIKDTVGNIAVLSLPSTGSSDLYQRGLVIDTTPLTVTVNQNSSQSDPTNALPVVFKVDFNKPILPSTFTSGDIAQNGTATGVTWSITDSGNHQSFTLAATAVGGNGTIVPSIQANQVQDAAGNNNAASVSTDNSVTYDNVMPTITSVTTTTPTGYYNNVIKLM